MSQANTAQPQSKSGLSVLEIALAGCLISICLFGAIDLLALFGGW